MLQLMSVDSRHFTQPDFSPQWSDLHEIEKMLLSAFPALIRHVTFVKMAPLVRAEKLNHLLAFITS